MSPLNTFMPLPDYQDTAECLDFERYWIPVAERWGHPRLANQAREVVQILIAILDPTTGWQNHPAVNMWRGNVSALTEYGLTICDAATAYGYDMTNARERIDNLGNGSLSIFARKPWFMGEPDFHLSHQSNLVRKRPDYYRRFFPDVPDDLPYLWPTPDGRFVYAKKDRHLGDPPLPKGQ